MPKCAVAFGSTGGFKLIRALRSFRRIEPDLPVLVVIDTHSKSWQEPSGAFELDRAARANVNIVYEQSPAYINGTLNTALRHLIRYDRVALFHDDVIFPPPMYAKGQITEYLNKDLLYSPTTAGITLNIMQLWAPHRLGFAQPPALWDRLDLEHTSHWAKLLPGQPRESISVEEYFFGGHLLNRRNVGLFDVSYITVRETQQWPRLGPSGCIIPVQHWKELGGFDEVEGIFYDIDYVNRAWKRGWHILAVPDVPHMHLHNQSLFADRSVDYGIWNYFDENYRRVYGCMWADRVRRWVSCVS